MKYFFKIAGLLWFLMVVHEGMAQENDPVHITGVVVSADSLEPLAFTSLTIKNSVKGTVSDSLGYFSIFANELDTIQFSNIGYKKVLFVVPENLPEDQYGLVQVMEKDTVLLSEIEVFAFPGPEDFEQAFLEIELKKTLQDRSLEAQAKLHRNLEQQWARNQFYYDQMRYSKLYNLTGISPPNNFLNPVTWSNFIKDWREGKFKVNEEYLPDFKDQ